ncbi:MAG: T9SS type A sorting domain-containing protein [Taibaiella sp.]|nr:T9SS type A sorting domain-containing protein [Taibaiella sp.]
MKLFSVPMALCALLFSTVPAVAQSIYTYAGDGSAAFGGDGAAATAAKVNNPHGVATDPAGNVYIADYENNRIRKVTPAGVISTIAGTGFGGYLASQDGGPATAAWIKWPVAIALDASGNIYFTEFGNNIIRKVNTAGIISTVAGVPGSVPAPAPAPSGDGGPATSAILGYPWGIAIDASGNIIVADQLNNRIRKVNTTTGIITSIAGNGFVGWTGDGGPATAARVNYPLGVAIDAPGNIYIADYANNRVRKINTSGIMSTIAGVGLPYGYSGDGGPATVAQLYYPKAIAVDAGGNVYIADWNNHAVRKINSVGIINTIAGTGTAGYSGDGGPAVSAQLNYPTGVAVRYDGDVFISDNDNNRVRRIKIGNEPYFSEGASKSVTTCPVELISLDTMLSVDDIDVGQTLTWSPLRLPAHGTLLASCTAPSTSSTVVPPCGSYVLTTGYVGTDTFSVRVNDGTYSDTIEFYVNIVGFPNPGAIAGSDSVCPGHNITLTNSYAGGVWSSTATGVATVSSSGVVTGVSAGVTTVSYTATNTCGTVVVTKIIYVPSTIPCIAAIAGATLATPKTRIVQGPDSGQFTVYLDGAAEAPMDVTVFDVSGRKVFSGNSASKNQLSFRLTSPDGLYVIKIQHLGRQYVVKTTLHK